MVFGTAAGFGASLDLAALDGTNGFRLDGIDADDHSGRSVAGAGDVNGDGIDDLIIGAPDADPGDRDRRRRELRGVRHRRGLRREPRSGRARRQRTASGSTGSTRYDYSGISVAGAGDVNGDGIDDLIIGAPRRSRRQYRAGESYVVFGTAAGFGASLDLAALDGSNGFRLDGIDDVTAAAARSRARATSTATASTT